MPMWVSKLGLRRAGLSARGMYHAEAASACSPCITAPSMEGTAWSTSSSFASQWLAQMWTAPACCLCTTEQGTGLSGFVHLGSLRLQPVFPNVHSDCSSQQCVPAADQATLLAEESPVDLGPTNPRFIFLQQVPTQTRYRNKVAYCLVSSLSPSVPAAGQQRHA